MKKIILIMLVFVSCAFAKVINEYPSQELIDSKIKIIDIRTPDEWKETGLLSTAVPITFFDEKGGYNVPAFMAELKKHVSETEKFALICHVGSRTAIVADFLDQTYHMQVINLNGGMVYAQSQGLKTIPYQSK